MHIWKTLKFFVSSTFKDLELERDSLSRIFQHLQEYVFQTRLSLIPYDLRWRDPDEPNLVRWCLDMVLQSQYFIGILGYRYGWRPMKNYQGQPNNEQVSITEMEIDCALRCIPHERRFFCFGDLGQYTSNQLSLEPRKDSLSLQRIKDRLLASGERVLIYHDQREAIDLIERELREMLDRDYPPGQKVALETYSRTDALAEIIEEKRRGFVGRSAYLQMLSDFCRSDNHGNRIEVDVDVCRSGNDGNCLALYAVAGTGKSALLAQFIHNWHEADTPLVIHYMSMAGDNRSVYGLLRSLGEQFRALGLCKQELENMPERLLAQVWDVLQNSKRRFLVLIDGLDEMEEDGHDLLWFPPYLASGVRLVITTRPVSVWQELQNNKHVRGVELTPLTDTEIRQIIAEQDRELQLHLQPQDQDLLSVRAAGNPLFLKVALDEMAAGGVAVGQMAETVDALFHQILKRLENVYGGNFIRDYLGLIAAGRSGLAEAELYEILAGNYGIEHEVLIHIYNALSNFVMQREKLLHFFHPEFDRSVKMFLGKGAMRGYHQKLAEFFLNRGYYYERTLTELIFQLQWGELYEQVLKTFADFGFWRTKVYQGMLVDLRQDLEFALTARAVLLPENLVVECAPGVYCNRNLLVLLARILDFDYHFLLQHPQSLLQCLWNRGYWYDSPAAAPHYENAKVATPDYENPPLVATSPKLSSLVEYWRRTPDANAGYFWLKILRPLPERLDSSLLRILRGHSDIVTAVAITADNSKIASGSWDSILYIWDMATGRCLTTIRGHGKYISAIAWMQDRRRIISSSGDKSIRMWDAETGKCLHIFHGHEKDVTCLCLSRDDTRLVSGAKDKSVRLWDVSTGQCLLTLHGHEKIVNGVALNADKTRIASASWDHTIRIWDTESGECLRVLTGHTDEVKTVVFTSDGSKVISGSKDHDVRIWDVQTGESLRVLPHDSMVFHVTLSSDEKRILASAFANISLWDLENGELLLTLQGHQSAVFCSAFSADGNYIVSGSGDKTVRLWDAASSREKLRLQAHQRVVTDVALSDNGTCAISCSRDHTLRKWKLPQGLCDHILIGHNDQVRGVHISADSRYAASGGDDHTVRVWDLSTNCCVQILKEHEKPVVDVCFNPAGNKLLSAGRDNMICLWDLPQGKCLRQFKGHTSYVQSIAWSQDETMIVSGAEDCCVRVWDTNSGECQRVFSGHKYGVQSVAISPDNSRIYSSARDNTVRIWDRISGECLQIIVGTGEVLSLSQPTEEQYTLASETELIVYAKKENQTPIAFFPIPLKKCDIHGNIVIGCAGIHVYLMEFMSI